MSRPECLKNSREVSLSAGQQIFGAGDPCQNFYYLLQGSIRVDLIAKSGKSILLYRFGANETCILTTSCLLSGEDYCAEAHVEKDIHALTLSEGEFLSLLATSAEFRQLVFDSFASRLSTMMIKIDEVAFSSLDSRIASRLLELNKDDKELTITHEQLAADIGTAREVISRRLAGWEKEGLIKRHRGGLKILSSTGLQKLCTPVD